MAHAWGPDGHQIVCLIAEDHLTPEAKKAIHAILGSNVNISDADVADWADVIRRDDRSGAAWHYVNIPVTAKGFDEERDGDHGNNVIDKTEECAKKLADPSTSKPDRVEALKYLVHLVGDLHQPLHCADRNGDKGGVTRLVFFPGVSKATGLHQVWDSKILIAMRGTEPIAKYADGLNAKITPADLEKWQSGSPVDWANESKDVAADVVYDGIPADGPPIKPPPQYFQRARPAIELQLEKGGIRLAMILNRVFAAAP